jgi:hypothetical protein
MKPKLKVKEVRFSEVDLRAWKKGDYSLVKDCPKPLRRILRKKAQARPGRRFFGEAYVAAAANCQDGWYGSYKWLTAQKWAGDEDLRNRYQGQFREALRRHFPKLRQFQEAVAASTRDSRGRKPVGPDLWLATPRQHRFIEVKLPGDRIARHQLLGLALIATFLQSDRPKSVEVVNLFSSKKPTGSDRLVEEFAAICSQLQRDGAN